MKFFLIVSKGKQQGFPIPIDVDLFTIGSGPMCQLRTKVPGIGHQQCAIVVRDRKIFIKDLGSEYCTVVNGAAMQPSEEWPIHAGDRLEVGALEFMVQFSELTLNKRDLEEWALKCLDSDESRTKNLVEELDEFSKIKETYSNASTAAQAALDRLQAQKGLVQGRLRISRENMITVVRINDVFLVEEAELALIKKELQENLISPNLRVLVDFKNVRKMSSMAAVMFSDLARWLNSWGSTMALCRVKSDLQHTLQELPAMKDIKFYADKPEALAEKW
jgi:predicted component of type VI protein secretion system